MIPNLSPTRGTIPLVQLPRFGHIRTQNTTITAPELGRLPPFLLSPRAAESCVVVTTAENLREAESQKVRKVALGLVANSSKSKKTVA